MILQERQSIDLKVFYDYLLLLGIFVCFIFLFTRDNIRKHLALTFQFKCSVLFIYLFFCYKILIFELFVTFLIVICF